MEKEKNMIKCIALNSQQINKNIFLKEKWYCHIGAVFMEVYLSLSLISLLGYLAY